MNFGFKPSADGLGVACLLKSDENGGAHLREARPPLNCFLANAGSEFFRLRKDAHVHAFGIAGSSREIFPNLLGREDENRRRETNEGAGNLPNGGLRGTA